MTYISFSFYVLVLISLILYYIIPLKFRWMILLFGSVVFYAFICPKNWPIVLFTVVVSFFMAKYLEKNQSRPLLVWAILICTLPWVLIKPMDMIFGKVAPGFSFGFLAPIGISFYTMQIISYLVDVYKKEVDAEKNMAKYLLFILYFPQIVQGPIPRYKDLSKQLFEGHLFDEQLYKRGLYNIAWGFFLKLMVADKAALFVNPVFDNITAYSGGYYFIAGVLYSIELYADFSGCFYICRGISKLFGIHIMHNFEQPYLATSIKDFWRRWHISLSTWLRDYIYIPLGGNRKGIARKYLNLIITFIVSGIWHGQGMRFIFWGMMHGIYQVIGDANKKFRVKNVILCRIYTFILVMLAWVIFRANSLRDGVKMIMGMIVHPGFSVFPEDTLQTIIDVKDIVVLVLAVLVVLAVGLLKERKVDLSQKVFLMATPLRWTLYVFVIFGIMIFGTYGLGFNSSDFIYGGF